MKKCFALGLVFLCLLAGGCSMLRMDQGEITALVQDHTQELEDIARRALEQGDAQGLSYAGVQEVLYHPEHQMVDFLCGGWGEGDQTVYVGFYYVPQDQPQGFQGTEMTLIQEGEAWTYEDPQGNSRYRTQRIQPGWFYYEMTF